MRYYTFEIDGQTVGYYEEQDDDGVFYCRAKMVIDGTLYDNPFWLRYDGNTVLATKYGTDDWRPFDQAEGIYPGSAVHILLSLMGTAKSMTYTVYNESDGTLDGERILRRNGNRIDEYAADIMQRYFIVDNGEIVEYGWGGTAKSVLVSSRTEALAGLPIP